MLSPKGEKLKMGMGSHWSYRKLFLTPIAKPFDIVERWSKCWDTSPRPQYMGNELVTNIKNTHCSCMQPPDRTLELSLP